MARVHLLRSALVVLLISITFAASAPAQKTRKAKPLAPAKAAPPQPGPAETEITKDGFSVSNAFLKASWRVSNAGVTGVQFQDRVTNRTLAAQGSPFVLLLRDG
jgi:hypothetical protein